MAWYVLRLERLDIAYTRANSTDTDLATFSVKVGDQLFPPAVKALGDVQIGRHDVGLEIGPVWIDDTDRVVISYLVVNSGYDASSASDTQYALDTISELGADVANDFIPGLGTIGNKLIQWFHSLEFANCDGVVAIDTITLTGAALRTLTSDGTHRETRGYPGNLDTGSSEYQLFNSKQGCGPNNSSYGVTWSVATAAPRQGQRVLGNFPGVVAVAGYFASGTSLEGLPQGDHLQHVIVATNDGSVTELWTPGIWQAIGQNPLTKLPGDVGTDGPGIVGLAGFFAPKFREYGDPGGGDDFQHVIIATNDAKIHDRWFKDVANPGNGEAVIGYFPGTGTFPSILGVAGYMSDDRTERVVVATNDGEVQDLWFKGPTWDGAAGQFPIEKFPIDRELPRVVALATYYAARDKSQHLIIATSDGDVHDLRGAGQHHQHDVRAHFNGIVGVAGYYDPADGFQHIIVLTADGLVNDVWFHGASWAGSGGQDVRAAFDPQVGLVGVTALYNPVDKYQHVIVATGDGNVTDVFNTP